MKLLERLLESKTKKKKERDGDILRKIRLAIPSQGASISPPLGPALGQFGINIIDFCKQFNEKSQIYDVEVVLNVIITMFRNKNFIFEIKQPSFTYMLYEYYNSELIINFQQHDAGDDKEDFFRTISDYEFPVRCYLSHLYRIAALRSHISGEDLRSVMRMLKASLDSMHIVVVDDISNKKN